MTEHTVTAFEQELQDLTRSLANMGGMAEKAITDAISALNRRDLELAHNVIKEDDKIDILQREVEQNAVLIIAKRQPMAQDLREIVGALRISNDLERIGDLAKNIGKRVVAMSNDLFPQKLLVGLEHLSQLALMQLKNVLDAYTQKNSVMAISVWNRDGGIDQVYTSLFRELLTYMMEDPRNITPCTHLLFTAKNLERIGDHATNIAETVCYMTTGEVLQDTRPKDDGTTNAPVVPFIKKG
ncbi:MAG: phosphate signaling complex protein PhoU [Pseudomonadota bacterium]